MSINTRICCVISGQYVSTRSNSFAITIFYSSQDGKGDTDTDSSHPSSIVNKPLTFAVLLTVTNSSLLILRNWNGRKSGLKKIMCVLLRGEMFDSVCDLAWVLALERVVQSLMVSEKRNSCYGFSAMEEVETIEGMREREGG